MKTIAPDTTLVAGLPATGGAGTMLAAGAPATGVAGAPATGGAELKLGGALAVLGGAGYMAVVISHGGSADTTTEGVLRHIASRPEWPLVHLGGIVSVLCWVGAFVAMAHSLPAAPSRLLGRLAVHAITIGAAVFVIYYSIDGYATKEAADAWASAAAGPEKDTRLLVAEAMLGPQEGTYRSFVALLFGLPFVLMGAAVAASRQYPRWLGWLAGVAGTGAVVGGMTLFLNLDVVPDALLFGGFVLPLNIWLVVMGVLLWRRG